MTLQDIQKERDKEIEIVVYNTIESLIEFMYKMPIEEIKECEHGGVDQNGEEVEYGYDDMIDGIKEQGCYGCATEDNEIHVWIDKCTLPETIISFLAHERGHLIEPENEDPIEEEVRAEMFSVCAEFAYANFNKYLTTKQCES